LSRNDAGTARVNARPSPSLDRRLGPLDAAAIVVSNVIGSGIFFVPTLVAALVSDARAILFVWALGGALAFAGAMAYAELAALRPHAGGEYVYLRDAFGPAAGFLSGWTSFVAGFSGAIAASAIALADYTGRFLPAAADASPLLTLPIPGIPLVVSRKTLVALAAIGALAIVHIRGLRLGRVVQNGLTAVKVAALVLFIALGFSIGHGVPAQLTASGTAAVAPMLLALIPIMFTYSGWNAGAYVAEEVRDPERNVPLALGLGTLAVIAIYLSLNALYLYALPVSEMAALEGRLSDTVAERLFGFTAGSLIAAFTIVSLAASMSAMMIAGPRVYFAMARDGLFATTAREIHPKFRAPAHAVIAQAIWSGVLVLSGTLSELVNYTGFAVVLFSAVAVSAVFVLRRRQPLEVRPFRAWGYPWAPAAFVIASAAMLGSILVNTPLKSSGWGLAIIAAGLPIYWWMRRGARDR
jgi:APA family basic amino acid/polyamine antiporter